MDRVIYKYGVTEGRLVLIYTTRRFGLHCTYFKGRTHSTRPRRRLLCASQESMLNLITVICVWA